MTYEAIKRRVAKLEAEVVGGNAVHVMIPPGWLDAQEYERWHTQGLAEAPAGAFCLAVRFVRPGEAAAVAALARCQA